MSKRNINLYTPIAIMWIAVVLEFVFAKQPVYHSYAFMAWCVGAVWSLVNILFSLRDIRRLRQELKDLENNLQ